MPHIHSFAPISDSSAKTLILGSIPSIASLHKQQYYGHPQNVFWKIMSELLSFDVNIHYEKRCNALIKNHIGVWDVLKCCTRQGSLDSGIDNSSVEVNDFETFFINHPQVKHVFFNGAKAEQVFLKHFGQSKTQPPLILKRLPSTSPAHAAVSFEQKLIEWKSIICEDEAY